MTADTETNKHAAGRSMCPHCGGEVVGERAEPLRVLTIRLPATLYREIQTEAHDRRTSMNRLCIRKLRVPVEEPAGGSEQGDTNHIPPKF